MRLLIFIFILVGKMSVSASEIILEAREEKTVQEITKFKQSGNFSSLNPNGSSELPKIKGKK